MPVVTHGSVSVEIPAHIAIPEAAGSLTFDEVQRLEKARRGVGLVCEQTAEAMRKHPEKLAVQGIVADALQAAGKAAEDIDMVIADLEALTATLRQANHLLDAQANRELRKVLAHVRAQERFDPMVATLTPSLLAYFGAR